jgi:hypothetical protein
VAGMTLEQIKDLLGISDFRELGVRHAVQLADMIPDMDKEVRLKVIEQLPELVRFAVEAISSAVRAQEAVVGSSDQSRELVHRTCQEVIGVYAEQLRRDDLDPETRRDLYERLERAVIVEFAADAAHKRLLSDTHKRTLMVVGGVVVVVALAVGVRVGIRSSIPV